MDEPKTSLKHLFRTCSFVGRPANDSQGTSLELQIGRFAECQINMSREFHIRMSP